MFGLRESLTRFVDLQLVKLTLNSASFSSSSVLAKKRKWKQTDPIPVNTRRIPLEEMRPASDGEPRPNSAADFEKQLTIQATNLDTSNDLKISLKWSRAAPHLETPKFPGEHVSGEWPPKGRVYWKLPFKVKLQEGRIYKWCSCGISKTQPLCDGSHKELDGPNAMTKTAPKFRPTKFKVPATGEYWLCQCKQTKDRPFCDGTHRLHEEITRLERPMITDGERLPVKIKT